MFRSRSVLPLQRDVTGSFLPWIIALMVYLATLALAGAMALSDLAARWDTGLSGTLTVEIPPPASAGAPPLGAQVQAALDILRSTPGIARADAVPAAEIDRLLSPWLGSGALTPDLPVPALIDVGRSAAPLDLGGLRARLAGSVPGALIDDHARWLADILAVTRTVQGIAAGIVVLVGAGAAAAVVFVARAGLAIHAQVVELLHLIGAPDRYVARQFQAHVLGLAIQGCLFGTALAAATLLGLNRVAGRLDTVPLPAVTLAPAQWAALAGVPVAAAALAALTARITVIRALARLP